MARALPILRFRVEGGHFYWLGIDGKKYAAALIHLEGKEGELTIGPKRRTRSIQQTRYYFGVIVARIAELAGYGPDEHESVHEALKARFLTVMGADSPLPIVRGYRTLTTVEAEEYHEHCRRFAAETWGAYIELPCEAEMPSESPK